MKEKLFTGIHSALFSIYDEKMDVKRDTVAKLVDYQLAGGVSGFYVGGNTGECTVLPNKTRKQMLETVAEANAGRGRIMAHIGAGHFDDVMDLLEHANWQRIDAVASLPPSLQSYYDHQETIAYYRCLAKASKHPVYAYVTPISLQHSDLLAFAWELSRIEGIAGIKVTIPDYYRFALINRIDGGRLNNLNGPDEMLLCGLSVGADGAIGTTYNVIPKIAVKVYENYRRGDMKTALLYQNRLNDFVRVLMPYNGTEYWKAPLAWLGFDVGYTVFPTQPIPPQAMEKLKAELEEIGFFDMV